MTEHAEQLWPYRAPRAVRLGAAGPEHPAGGLAVWTGSLVRACGHTRRGARAEGDEAAQGRFYPSRWRSRSSLRPPSAPGPPPNPPTPTIHPVEGQM